MNHLIMLNFYRQFKYPKMNLIKMTVYKPINQMRSNMDIQ